MRRLRVVVLRLADLFHKERRERELAEEIEGHLQMDVDDRRRAASRPRTPAERPSSGSAASRR